MWSDLSKVIQNNKLDFLRIDRFQRKQAIAWEFPKLLWETKFFLPAANFHGHELQVLVKMYITGRKLYKDSLEKLTYFLVKNFYYHF